MACSSVESKALITDECGGGATITAIHPDIIETHILTRLDGPALASAAATSSQLRALSSDEHLWANATHSTWPSTSSPRVRHVISTFPNGSRSFFSDSFPASSRPINNGSRINLDRTPELISAVDLFHRQSLILSKVVETETETGWFRCSPFRLDVIDPEDAVRTPVKHPVTDDTCRELREELKLSWIVIDPARRRAVNVSSRKAVSVQRHWLSGELQARFATSVHGGEVGTASEVAMCSAVVTLGEGLQVREVSLQIEDLDGLILNGRDSLVILQRALEGKRERVKDGSEGEGYREFVEKKKEWKEEKVRAEGRLDMICMGLAAVSFLGFSGLFVFWR